MGAPTGDVALACASLLVDELVHGGMEHACLSPGSRSTPISLALARHPDVRVHVHLDERASAFFALGIAKATHAPVAVACTSGTAAANFLPAVVEASQARVRLVLLTADRPPELRGTGANQTIDHVELYGKYARWFEDAPLPAEGDGVTWRRLGSEAIERGLAHPPGPTHVNLPFAEPLVPSGADVDLRDPGPILTPHKLTSLIQTSGSRTASSQELDRLLRQLRGVERGAVVIGSWPQGIPEDATYLGHRLGWPVLAEPTSRGREPGGLTLSAGQALLADGSWIADHVPDIVVQVGAAPTTRATQAFVARARRLIVVDDFYPDPDPERRATWRLHAQGNHAAAEIANSVEPASSTTGWLNEWRRADAAARGAIDALVDSWDEPFEGRVARDLAAAVPDRDSALVVGSSMPIRDLDYYMAPRGLRVVANRGASGIDGFVSTALGVAASERRTYALCGDLTLLHDAGSLLWNASRGLDAVFIVLNNDGGAIFSFLPQRELPEAEELFATPHGLDLAALADAAGAGHVRVERATDLIPAVERAAEAGGVHLVEVTSDRELNLRRHAEVGETVAAALASL